MLWDNDTKKAKKIGGKGGRNQEPFYKRYHWKKQ
jgi:hypothetical protein